MNCDAVILAGGFGTRLRGVLGDIPKPMAPIAGRPFLEWQLDYLRRQGVRRVTLAVGYRADLIAQHFGSHWDGLELGFSLEDEPLGTGGAIRLALQRIRSERAFVLNGDSLAAIDLCAFLEEFEGRPGALGMAVAEVPEVGRYGRVTFDPATGKVLSVGEKLGSGPGLINIGVYCLPRDLFDGFPEPGAFSFEQSVLSDRVVGGDLYAFAIPGEFIDIGIPDDFVRAQTIVPKLVAGLARTPGRQPLRAFSPGRPN